MADRCSLPRATILPAYRRDSSAVIAPTASANGKTFDQRLEPAGLPPEQQFGKVPADQGRVALGLRAPDDADDRDVLDQDQIGRDRLDATRGKADDQHPRLPADRPQRLVERVAADGVVDDIGAFAA